MSGLIDAGGKIYSGFKAKEQAYNEAKQLEDKAGFTRALSQREGIEERRQADLLQSRALAVAAASGGGVSDPTVVNIIADLEEEGLRRSLDIMASGETAGRYMEKQAKMKRSSGKAALISGFIGGASSVAGEIEKAMTRGMAGGSSGNSGTIAQSTQNLSSKYG